MSIFLPGNMLYHGNLSDFFFFLQTVLPCTFWHKMSFSKCDWKASSEALTNAEQKIKPHGLNHKIIHYNSKAKNLLQSFYFCNMSNINLNQDKLKMCWKLIYAVFFARLIGLRMGDQGIKELVKHIPKWTRLRKIK